jgi:hypothetical protein
MTSLERLDAERERREPLNLNEEERGSSPSCWSRHATGC